MNYIDFSYRGFCLHANPSEVTMCLKKNCASSVTIGGVVKVREKNETPVVIKGKGILCGTQAHQQMLLLISVFKAKGSAYLFSPAFGPMKAFFTDLTFGADATENCIEYTFEFTEDCTQKKRYKEFRCTYALENENLYDIADRTGVSVERLTQLNDFENLFSVSKGDRIWLK